MKRIAAVLVALCALAAAVACGVSAASARAQVPPHRSFQRLVTGNGHVVASYDRVAHKLDFLLEHPYRFARPRADAPDLCFAADESRDLLYDALFGVRTPGRGEWTSELPLESARYDGDNALIVTRQHAGAGRALRVETTTYAPFAYDGAALVMALAVTNEGAAPVDVTPYAVLNLHLGAAGGGREPSADGEEVSWDATRGAFYEYSAASQGTAAYVPLADVAHATATVGASSAFAALHAQSDLDDVRATTGATSDVAPGLEGETRSLAPGETRWWGVAILWALDEDAGPKVDALRAALGGGSVDAIVQRERDAWTAWGAASLDDALIRMAQVREPGAGFGQILASLPPALGDPGATWNIAWVRDMAYATVALARSGHLQEAHDALAFYVHAGPGRHVAEVGMPYRVSVTRYFGDGEEESDCNADGPNVEFDGFGLVLWALDEYLRAGGDVDEVRSWFPEVRDGIADVLASLVDSNGIVAADSSIWETHWNGQQRQFTYTSLAATRGLCSAAAVATALGETDAAMRWSTLGARVRDAVVARHTDGRGALAQSAEDLAAGHGYLDASAVDAVSWGLVDPRGRTATATLAAVRGNLGVASGHGFMRNDDGGFYDSQEWVFVDERVAAALRATGDVTNADALQGWVAAQTAANDGMPSELYDPATGDYGGSPPMIGFGAAQALLGDDAPLPAACGAYATEPAYALPDAGVADAGGDASPTPDAGTGGSGGGCCSAAGTGGRSGGAIAALLVALVVVVARRRRRALPLLVALLFATAACGDDPDVHVDAGPRDAAATDLGGPSSTCHVVLHYHETRAAPRVHVAGDWNAFSMTADELVDDFTGDYRIALTLTPGVHAYKLYVEGDGAEPWRFDPDNPYRTYAGTPLVENSGLRVPDCTRPGMVVEHAGLDSLGAYDAVLHAEPTRVPPRSVIGELRSAGSTIRRPLTSTELRDLGGGSAVVYVDLTSLPDDKYTVAITPIGFDGAPGDDTLLPFWKGPAFDWRQSVVYMVMTDRYRNGDPSNDVHTSDAAPGADFAGGDYQGITQSIDDGTLATLGVNTLWISPFNTNPAGTFLDADGTHRVSGYHGYWPIAPRDVDPRFGGADALHALVASAHAHGIRILMDLVVNHVHQEHPYFRDHPDWFNTGCVCGTSGCDWTEHRLDCLFQPYLPDINWSVPAANEQFLADALWWMEEYDLDGFRVDAVKHVADSAITNLGTRVRERFEQGGTRVFLMGETAMGWDGSAGPDAGGNVENYGTIRRYLGPHGLDGQFDFPLYYAAALQFTSDTPMRGLSHVEFWTLASQREYGPDAIMTPYIGSHDTSRFVTLTSDPGRAGNKWSDLPTAPSSSEAYDRMYLALAWLMAVPGAPLLYYGDEHGEFGGADPDNRHSWRAPSALSPLEQAQLARVSALVHARAAIPAAAPIVTHEVSDDLWVFERGPVLVALNRGASPTTTTIVPPDGATATSYTDLLTATPHAVTHGAIDVTVPARGAVYLAP